MSRPSRTKKDQLYTDLKHAILTMELRPGADLEETKLAETYALSRTPLREVFRKLAGEGYTTIHQNRSVRVSEMSHTTLRNFFLTAPMVYGAVLRLAAQNGTPAQIADLKNAQISFNAALNDGTAGQRALSNNQFHEITGKMAHNLYLEPSFNRLLIDHARIGMTFYQPLDPAMAENLTVASQHHDAIIDSIEARDEATAAQLAIDHWNLSRDQIETFVMPDALDAQLGSIPTAKQA